MRRFASCPAAAPGTRGYSADRAVDSPPDRVIPADTARGRNRPHVVGECPVPGDPHGRSLAPVGPLVHRVLTPGLAPRAGAPRDHGGCTTQASRRVDTNA